MASPDTAPDPHEEAEKRFSDYHERVLPPAEMAEVEAHLAACEQCRAAYGELEATVAALAELGKVPAPHTFQHDVAETIRRRSAGRFFGRKAFGERIPLELLAIVVLLAGLLVFFFLRASPIGSLRYDGDEPQPRMAPGAKDVVPQPAPAE